MTDPIRPLGIRQLLGFEPISPQSRCFMVRSSQRSQSDLLPRERTAVATLDPTFYRGHVALLKARKPIRNAVSKSADKKPAISTKKDAKEDEKKGALADSSKGKDAKAVSKPDAKPDEWTSEQDAELTRMKQGGSTWVHISTALGKAQHLCKKRWKEIMPKDQEKEKPGGNGKKDKKAKAKGPNGKNQGDGRGQKQGGKDDDTLTSVYEFASDGRLHKRILADDEFPPEVLQYAGRFDDDWYWLNMSSRLFDKYGKRYTPQELKAKVAGQT